MATLALKVYVSYACTKSLCAPPFLQPMKDWVLFIIVAVILAFDVVFLIVVSVDVWRLRLRQELVIRSVRKNVVFSYVHVIEIYF